MMKAMTVGFAGAFGLLASVASAQVLWSQPWVTPRASFESRVKACTSPTPTAMIALDDWVARANSPITRLDWWGTLSTPEQGKRKYYIAIYKHDPATKKPAIGSLLFRDCVTPTAEPVGVDCKSMRVYKLMAKLTKPFYQKKGVQYWLQISESDADSYKVGVEDFRWSGTRPIRFLPAVQAKSAAAISQPILDLCDQKPDDLAFILYRT